jgi:hypothetical protein
MVLVFTDRFRPFSSLPHMSLTHVDPHVSEIVMVWIQSGDLLMVWIQISLNILYRLQFGRNAQSTPQNQFLVLSRLLGKHEIMRRAFFLDNADTKKLPVARRN